jgi:hypothetical protein
VSLAHVVIGADHAALEDREEVFGGVGVLEATGGDVLAGAFALTLATWKLRTWPSRSTSATTGCLGFTARVARFFCFPPT